MIGALIVYYDETCAFCIHCAAWLAREAKHAPISLVPRSQMPRDLARFSDEELVVLDDRGGIYVDAAAFLICLWALEVGRPWAMRLASPALLPLARRTFKLISERRQLLSRWLRNEPDSEVREMLLRAAPYEPPRCAR